MKAVKLIVGLTFLFSTIFIFSHISVSAQEILKGEGYYEKTPVLSPSPSPFKTPQEAVISPTIFTAIPKERLNEVLSELLGSQVEVKGEDIEASYSLLEDGTKVILLNEIERENVIVKFTYNKTADKIIIESQFESESQKVKITIDSNLVDKIKVMSAASIDIYGKDDKQKEPFILLMPWRESIVAMEEYSETGIRTSEVFFPEKADVEIGGNEEGKLNSVKVKTEAGNYLIETLADGNVKITTTNRDTISLNPNDFGFKHIDIESDGRASFWLADKDGRESVDFDLDPQGKISSVELYKYNGSITGGGVFPIERGEGVNLNLIANSDGSVMIKSNVEKYSIALKAKPDGSLEAIKSKQETTSITGDVQKVTFNKDGSLTLTYKDGTTTTESKNWLERRSEDISAIINYLHQKLGR